MLAQQYLIFSHGPHNQPSSGSSVRESFCNIYNGDAYCHREACSHRHMCKKCKGPHPGCLCPSIGPTRLGRNENRNKKTGLQIIQIQKRLTTPVSVENLEAAFSSHPNQIFFTDLCNIFKYGAHIGFQGKTLCQVFKKFANRS